MAAQVPRRRLRDGLHRAIGLEFAAGRRRHSRRRAARGDRRFLPGSGGEAAEEGAPTVKTATFRLRTAGRECVVDITERCAGFAREAAEGGDGLLHVFVPHATAGLAVMELGAGSDADLLAVLAGLLPAD